jgi:hypothetical protein
MKLTRRTSDDYNHTKSRLFLAPTPTQVTKPPARDERRECGDDKGIKHSTLRSDNQNMAPTILPWVSRRAVACIHDSPTHQQGHSLGLSAIKSLHHAGRLGRDTINVMVVEAVNEWWQPAYRKSAGSTEHGKAMRCVWRGPRSEQPTIRFFSVLTTYNRLIHQKNGLLRSCYACYCLGKEGPA